jgi:hypothetical protein
MTTALDRALPELFFDDVGRKLEQLASDVRSQLSERITDLTEGDITVSYNRSQLIQLSRISSARISVVSQERAEEIKAEAATKLANLSTVYDVNANLLNCTEKTINYIASAITFFSETMKDNETTLKAKRKADVEKQTAQEKVTVCRTTLDFLKENDAIAKELKTTINHNRNGRNGESAQLAHATKVLEPVKTWGEVISNKLGFFWSGGGKPADAAADAKVNEGSAEIGGGGSATKPEASTSVVVQAEATATAPGAPAPTEKKSFKDAVDQKQLGRAKNKNRDGADKKAS